MGQGESTGHLLSVLAWTHTSLRVGRLPRSCSSHEVLPPPPAPVPQNVTAFGDRSSAEQLK